MANTYNEAGYAYNDSLSAYNSLGAAPAAFPLVPTQVRVDLNIAGVWTNITGDVYTSEKIQISRGRQDEASSAQPSTCNLVLNNRTGKYTPKNPVGVFYPNFTRNTPIRVGVGVPPAGTALGGQSGTSITAPTMNAETAGLVLTCWAVESPTATITIPGGYSPNTLVNGSLVSSIAGAGTTPAGTVPPETATSSVAGASAAATCFIPGAVNFLSTVAVGQNYSVGSEYTPVAVTPINALAGDVLVMCVVWSQDPNNAMIAAPWDSSQSSEWSLTADSGQTAANSPRVQIWTRYCPIAEPTLSVSAQNWVLGAADLQATFYQVRGATPWNPRFHGFCADISSTADLSGNDVRCTIQAGSILRQRSQGSEAPHSALYRFFSNSNSVAYWSLEGGTSTTALTSPFAGVPNAVVAVPPTIPAAYGQDSTSFISSDPLPVLTSGYVSGQVPNYAATTASGGAVYGASFIPAAPTVPGGGILWATIGGGTLGTAILTYTNSTQATFTVFNTSGVSVSSTAVTFGAMVGSARQWFIAWSPTAANPTTQTDFTCGYSDVNNVTSAFTALAVTGTTGAITRVSVGQEPSNTVFFDKGITVGHMAVSATCTGATGSGFASATIPRTIGRAAVQAWSFEPPVLRFLRICQEESIPLSTAYWQQATVRDATQVPAGPQLSDDALNILFITQVTDMGELAESRCTTGLSYRPGPAMQGRPVVAVVDYAAKMIAGSLDPVDDDQNTRNDVTVTQQNGSSVEVTQASGPLSVLLPPNGVGIYTGSYTVSVAYQGRDLPYIAQEYLAQGVINQQRFANVTMLLEAVPSSVTTLAAIDIGQHVQIANTPIWVQPGPSDVIILGMTELIGPIAEWEITFNARPYGPNAVLRVDSGDSMSRIDSGTSAVTAGITSTATSMGVTVGRADDGWSNANCPFDILVTGERMTVTAISGTVPTQTFTVTRSVNGVVKPQATGAVVNVYYQTYVGIAGSY